MSDTTNETNKDDFEQALRNALMHSGTDWDSAVQRLLTFDSRASYLEWVSEWKAMNVREIRECRAAKKIMRDGSRTDGDRANAQECREVKRRRLHFLYDARVQGKREAARQRRAALVVA